MTKAELQYHEVVCDWSSNLPSSQSFDRDLGAMVRDHHLGPSQPASDKQCQWGNRQEVAGHPYMKKNLTIHSDLLNNCSTTEVAT